MSCLKNDILLLLFWQYAFPAEVSTTFAKCLDLYWKFISWYQRSSVDISWKLRRNPEFHKKYYGIKWIVTEIVWNTLLLSEYSARPKSHGKELPLFGPLNACQMLIRAIHAYLPHSLWCHQMETFSVSLAFLRGIHRSPVNSPQKGQWRGALTFSLICAGINGWANNGDAGDLRRHLAHYDVIAMLQENTITTERLSDPQFTNIILISVYYNAICIYHWDCYSRDRWLGAYDLCIVYNT